MTTIGYSLYAAHLQFKERKVGGNNELVLGKSGIKISSPFLGLMILAVSLGFLYLYLVYVFPIDYASDVNSSSDANSSTERAETDQVF